MGSEIDILATKDCELVVIEVKYRSQTQNLAMENLIPAKKIACLRNGIDSFLRRSEQCYDSIRLDIALVYPEKKTLGITYWENAFDLSGS